MDGAFTNKTAEKVKEVLTSGYVRRTRALQGSEHGTVVRLFMGWARRGRRGRPGTTSTRGAAGCEGAATGVVAGRLAGGPASE